MTARSGLSGRKCAFDITAHHRWPEWRSVSLTLVLAVHSLASGTSHVGGKCDSALFVSEKTPCVAVRCSGFNFSSHWVVNQTVVVDNVACGVVFPQTVSACTLAI